MILTLHITAVILTGLLVLYADEQALMWMLGRQQVLAADRIKFLHNAIAIGLGLLIVTGALMYAQAAASYLSSPTFVVKMVAVGALILNAGAITTLSSIATTRSFTSLSLRERMPLFISGAVSATGWITAIVCGLLLG